MHLTQRSEDVLVRTGSTDVMIAAAPYAHTFLAYALLADQTCENNVYERASSSFQMARTATRRVTVGASISHPFARSILEQWRLVFASTDPAQFPCMPGRSPCTAPVGGLGVQIWVGQTGHALRRSSRRLSRDGSCKLGGLDVKPALAASTSSLVRSIRAGAGLLAPSSLRRLKGILASPREKHRS